MATQTLHASTPVFASLKSFFSAIGNGLVAAAENSSRMKRIQALQSMTDAQLAAIGIKRDDIVRHVFSDLFYV